MSPTVATGTMRLKGMRIQSALWEAMGIPCKLRLFGKAHSGFARLKMSDGPDGADIEITIQRTKPRLKSKRRKGKR